MNAGYIEAPRFAILKTSGINRDFATQAAIQIAGGEADIIHISQLTESPKLLFNFRGLIIPGGFANGDDIQSGVVLALRMQRIKAELEEFAFQKKRPIIGVCNGFQALIQSGLLPFGSIVSRELIHATLTNNESGKFESNWVTITSQESKCPYIVPNDVSRITVAHGEGNLQIEGDIPREQIVYLWVDEQNRPTQEYPANPNGSPHAIAGICDSISGTVLGLMPHHEDNQSPYNEVNWRRKPHNPEPDGIRFYKQIVVYAANV